MEEMIEACVPHMVSATGMNENEARATMCVMFPTLKRWRQS